MRHDEDTQEWALADRLISYSDAVAAVAFLGASGLGIAVAEPDARSSIASVAEWIIVSNILLSLLLTAMLILLRRWETDLRSDLPPAAKARRYSRYLHWARLVVVWASGAQAVGIMLAIRL